MAPNKTETPIKPEVVKEPQDPISELKKLVDGMTDQQRERLEQVGVFIPAGDLTRVTDGSHEWGLRCTECNKIALFFVGSKWNVNGTEHTEPPILPHYKIAWTQHLPPSEIDRNTPRCQHCGCVIPLNGDDSFSRERFRIQRIDAWQASRDKSFERSNVRRVVSEATKDTGVHAAELSTNYNLPDEPVSNVIERQRGEGALQELEMVAEATGATAALKRGFKE